jgi:hypothetical protein
VTTAEAVGPPAPEAAEEAAPGLVKRATTNLRQGNLGIFPIVVG